MKLIAIIGLIAIGTVFVVLSVCAPAILAKNEFLVGFINQEILSIMAVIMAISIASIATIHLWFNERSAYSERHDDRSINPRSISSVYLLPN